MLGFMWVLAVWIGSVAIGLLIATMAMVDGGRVTLDFNQYNEGWLEVFGLAWALLLTPWAYKRVRPVAVRYADCPRCTGGLVDGWCMQCGWAP